MCIIRKEIKEKGNFNNKKEVSMESEEEYLHFVKLPLGEKGSLELQLDNGLDLYDICI